MSATTFATLIKESMANMPDILNTKKEIDEYYMKAVKDVKEKITKENKEGKAPRKALGVKPVPKKRPKKNDVDADGNEIEKVKKAPNAYQQYIKDNRPKVKEENPGLNNEEYFTLLANMWNKHKVDMKTKDAKEEDKKEEDDAKDEDKKEDKEDEVSEITVDADDKKKEMKDKKDKKAKKDP
jgi:hypothetical protein